MESPNSGKSLFSGKLCGDHFIIKYSIVELSNSGKIPDSGKFGDDQNFPLSGVLLYLVYYTRLLSPFVGF